MRLYRTTTGHPRSPRQRYGKRASVVECASPLALSPVLRASTLESARGLAHSKTLARLPNRLPFGSVCPMPNGFDSDGIRF